MELPYSLDQTPRLLFISSRSFVWLLIESSYYSRAAFIKLGVEGENPLPWGTFQGGVAADTRESIRRDTATLAIATDTELEESDHFADFEEDENELEENKLVLEHC